MYPAISVWHLLIAFSMGGILTLMSVALGGFLVFRTRRDSHEPLFGISSPKAEAFVLDPMDETETKEDNEDIVPGLLKKRTDAFLEQLKKGGERVT